MPMSKWFTRHKTKMCCFVSVLYDNPSSFLECASLRTKHAEKVVVEGIVSLRGAIYMQIL